MLRPRHPTGLCTAIPSSSHRQPPAAQPQARPAASWPFRTLLQIPSVPATPAIASSSPVAFSSPFRLLQLRTIVSGSIAPSFRSLGRKSVGPAAGPVIRRPAAPTPFRTDHRCITQRPTSRWRSHRLYLRDNPRLHPVPRLRHHASMPRAVRIRIWPLLNLRWRDHRCIHTSEIWNLICGGFARRRTRSEFVLATRLLSTRRSDPLYWYSILEWTTGWSHAWIEICAIGVQRSEDTALHLACHPRPQVPPHPGTFA
ncbi:uncharacterized protein C8Q71DRAFT_305350 [Rhodofomes roseus]|uniref:Uncharacterized protein n=1 Tax=Rhodofomes roseus TaxID=34475 RepID=A0ABQ8K3S0_9APHY|nr:uncharacterized protein C8Q71DRAFT_305350 [Rhodofomes roseus]KAH9831481.1 hypothetical protein C8Q71DRAFT_305350 [Rhodofomes roseus]